MINNNSLPRVQYPAMKNKQTEKKIASDQNEVNGDILGVGGGGKILNGNNQKGIYLTILRFTLKVQLIFFLDVQNEMVAEQNPGRLESNRCIVTNGIETISSGSKNSPKSTENKIMAGPGSDTGTGGGGARGGSVSNGHDQAALLRRNPSSDTDPVNSRESLINFIENEQLFREPKHRAELTRMIRKYVKDVRLARLLGTLDHRVFEDEANVAEVERMVASFVQLKAGSSTSM